MSHPNPAFAWRDEAAMRRFVAARGFATLAAQGDGAPVLAHLPVTVAEAGTIRFHVARANRIAALLDGRASVLSVTGDDHYVSPDWYGSPGEVPTWNYVAVEIEGVAHALDDAALVAQIDALSAVFEATLAPKPAWTREKMDQARFSAMLRAIRGFEVVPSAWRGTAKLAQHKSAAARTSLAAALAARGRVRAAAAVTMGHPG